MATSPNLAQHADHHYVPKFYLKGFANRNQKLWVYEKGTNQPRESKPKREANRADYYTFTDRGFPDDSSEKVLQKLESIVAPVIKKLANPQFEANPAQMSELYSFVALMFVRVPAFREFVDAESSKLALRSARSMAHNRDKFYKSLREYELKSGQSVGDYEKLRKFAASENYTIEQKSKGFNLLQIFRSFLSIAEVLENEYRHEILYAPLNLFFMTCDNPVVTLEPDVDGRAWVGMGFGRPGTQVLFPLNKHACLLLRRDGRNEKIHVNPQRTQQINDMFFGVAQKYAYAPEGFRRLSRIFNEKGCKMKYGENAFVHQSDARTRQLN